MEYMIKNGNTIPSIAPRISENFVNPYRCENMKAALLYCKGRKELIEKYLSVTPFQYVSDIFAILAADFANHDGPEGPYRFVSFVIPVEHNGMKGGYHMLTYNNNSDVVIRNREVFGYPDKLADIIMEDDADHFTCKCNIICTGALNGKKLIQIDIDKTASIHAPEGLPEFTPDIMLKTMGNPEGEGILYELALSRNELVDFEISSEKDCPGVVRLWGSEVDPLDELQPIEILGAKYVTGNFASTNENGWAVIREEVSSIDDYFKDRTLKY